MLRDCPSDKDATLYTDLSYLRPLPRNRNLLWRCEVHPTRPSFPGNITAVFSGSRVQQCKAHASHGWHPILTKITRHLMIERKAYLESGDLTIAKPRNDVLKTTSFHLDKCGQASDHDSRSSLFPVISCYAVICGALPLRMEPYRKKYGLHRLLWESSA